MSILNPIYNPFRRFGGPWGHFIDGEHFLGHSAFQGNQLQADSKLPATNIKKNEKSFDIEVALPGFNQDEVNIHLERGILKITAIRDEKNSLDHQWVIQEFERTTVSRIFYLHPNVDEEKITAKLHNGILHINLPYKANSPEQPTRKIQVN